MKTWSAEPCFSSQGCSYFPICESRVSEFRRESSGDSRLLAETILMLSKWCQEAHAHTRPLRSLSLSVLGRTEEKGGWSDREDVNISVCFPSHAGSQSGGHLIQDNEWGSVSQTIWTRSCLALFGLLKFPTVFLLFFAIEPKSNGPPGSLFHWTVWLMTDSAGN